MIYPESHKQHYKRMRLYEKAGGFAAPQPLSDQEILELILTYPILRANVVPIARELLREFGSVSAVLAADRRDLLFLGGVSKDVVSLFKLIDYIRKSMPYKAPEGQEYWSGQPTPGENGEAPVGFLHLSDAAAFCAKTLCGRKSELLLELLISPAGRLMGYMFAASGSGESVPVPIDVIVENAARPGVHGVVIAHNHPSGSPRPSEGDIEATRALASALQKRGQLLCEHFIIGGQKSYAMIEDVDIDLADRPDALPNL